MKANVCITGIQYLARRLCILRRGNDGLLLASGAPPGRKRTPMAASDTQKRVRALLADEHTMFREGFAQLLASHHKEVAAAGSVPNGEEAVTLTEREKPDLVIMQVETPIEKARGKATTSWRGSSARCGMRTTVAPRGSSRC